MVMDENMNANVRKGLWFLVGFLVVAVLVGVFFKAQIARLSEHLVATVGPAGLGVAVGLNDLIISPVPPDLLLLVLSKGSAPREMFGLVAMLGACSALGGTVAWFLSRRFGRPEWLGERFSTTLDEHHDLVRRYGAWAVGIAALTPVPFSLVCWVAGFVNLEFSRFAPMALLRIPRFLFYYAALLFSDEIASWIS